MYLALSVLGFGAMVAGLWLVAGSGWALLVGGLILFLVGGIGSAREERRGSR